MKETIGNADSERFESGADEYATYLATPEGRLRLNLSLANLREFLPKATQSLRVLDLGCGTGAAAVRMAHLDLHVTLVDSSSAMLDLAKRAAHEAGITQRVSLKHGDVTRLADLVEPQSFDVVLCHNIIEYLEDPAAVLRAATGMMRDRSAVMSVMVRNQAGEVLRAAIQAGDLFAADRDLEAEWGHESLYGGRVRLFTADNMHAMLKGASLALVAERGVRVVSDYLPSQISRDADYERILSLERKLGKRPEFSAVARYTQYIAHRADLACEDHR